MFNSGPEFNKDSWFSVKANLGLDFPNVSRTDIYELKCTIH